MGIVPIGHSMNPIFSLVLFMSIFTSCQTNGGGANAAPAPEFNNPIKQLNVSYGPDSLQRMDIHLPAGRSAKSTRSIVLIHGGGWNAGSKSDLAAYIDSFQRRMPDLAIFNLDYRLVSGNHIFPTQEMDVKQAIEFIAERADDYGISKDKVALLGVSAGAHLSLLHAYKYPEPIQVKAVIDFFGPTDLTEMYHKPWHNMIPYLLQALTGTTPQQKPDVYEQASPAHFVSRQSPPTLILQGGADPVVDASQSKLLEAKLKKAGVPHELVLYPRERHGWYGANQTHSFNKIEAFLQQHLR